MRVDDITQVRRLLRDSDPLASGSYENADQDERGRADYARIIATVPPARPDPVRRFVGWFGASPRRRRTSTVAGVIAVLVGMGAGAVAGGLVPDGVIHGFNKGGNDPVEEVRSDQAVEAGHLRLPNGVVYQIWIAPNKAGGECRYNRWLPPGGKPEDGSLECDAPHDPGATAETPLWVEYGREDGQYVVFAQTDRTLIVEIKRQFGVDLTDAAAIRFDSAGGHRTVLPMVKGISFGGVPTKPSAVEILDRHHRVLYRHRLTAHDHCAGAEHREGCTWQ